MFMSVVYMFLKSEYILIIVPSLHEYVMTLLKVGEIKPHSHVVPPPIIGRGGIRVLIEENT